MNIGITGGSGFIGSALCERLTAAGHRVVILDIRPPTRKIAGAEFIQADLMEGAVPSRILECDALIHLAGVPIFEKWTDEYKK
jgi:nucleoside-diphosphate-sugar epimerase